jgi:actin-related protein 6
VLDVGGKALTNQLKEWVSYRQIQVLEETYVMNQCKEDVCFVSSDFNRDMSICTSNRKSNALRRDYILPDFLTLKRGEVRLPGDDIEGTQKISLAVERFAIPEIIFTPLNINIDQMGIVEAIQHSLNNVPQETYYDMVQNILLIGGNANFSGFTERIQNDLRSAIDQSYSFGVKKLHDDAVVSAWKSAERLVRQSKLEEKFVTRAEYLENGPNLCLERFNDFCQEYY